MIITSCTGEKLLDHPDGLTLEDFQQGKEHVRKRESDLSKLLTPAEKMYTGQQHVRLMRGIEAIRKNAPEHTVDLWVLSAGYGLIPGHRPIAPYECTFTGMKKSILRSWADKLFVPGDVRNVLARPYDLGFILLGDLYLKACALDAKVTLGGPTLLFSGANVVPKLPQLQNLRKVALSNKEAKRFSCGLVGLKGEIASRVLNLLQSNSLQPSTLVDENIQILDLLDYDGKKTATTTKLLEKGPCVDFVINIPQSWWEKPHRSKLHYFIPEWDDLVDPDYDFVNDTHSSGGSDWANEVYAHQMYPEPNYDGILISKIVAEKNVKKKKRINDLGVHRYMRVPSEFPIMGDCGAFGYIMEEIPPYTTAEILEYYTRLGFNFGVSIDHLIVMATEQQKKFRYELTIHNAEEFIKEHKVSALPWTPIGAVQGWNPESYAAAAEQYVKMGYKYLALGGLVRSSTPEIVRVLDEVHRVVPVEVHVHLFGIARYKALKDFIDRGVTSLDSASVLRSAWLGADRNFLTGNGWYSAIRVPPSSGFRAKRLVAENKLTEDELHRLEKGCLAGLRDYAAEQKPPSDELLDILVHYDQLVAGERRKTRERIRRTLEDRPWEACGCPICARWGIEVAIFRGNNRNRRRGFHNTHVFYRLIERIMTGERIPWLYGDEKGKVDQMGLFDQV